MANRRWKAVLPYACALGGIGVALAWNHFVAPMLGSPCPFATVAMSVVLTAWLGGHRPAIVALLAGSAAEVLLLAFHDNSFGKLGVEDRTEMLFFGLTALVATAFAGVLHEARRRADRQSADGAKLLDVVTGSARLGLVVIAQGYRYLFANAAYAQIFGLEPGSIVGKRVPDVLPRAWAQIQPRLDTALRGVPISYELTIPRPAEAGGDRHFSVVYEPSTSPAGETTVAVVVVEITALKQSEAALRESEARLRLAQQVGRIGTFEWIAREDRNIWTRELEELYGLPRGGAPRSRAQFEALIHPEDRAEVVDCIGRAIVSGLPIDAEWRTIWPDGTTHTIAGRMQVFKDEAGHPVRVAGVNRDVTERVRLEVQLQQSQKMEAFGQLAGGVAHDFNNLVTIITGYSEMLIEALPVDSALRSMVTEIGKAGDRASALTRQLLAFSRKQVLEPRILDLNKVVAETEKMLRRLIGEDVQFTTALDPALCAVRVDPGQIAQVIMNLAVNARDAMPRGGRLTIETSNTTLDAARLHSNPEARPGNFVRLAISDTGHGMSAEVLARIFEPFFTTKGVGKGTGLGLAVVHGIVRQSGGHLEVDSRTGIGTTFNVYLPALGAPSGSRSPAVARPASPRGNETILLVEDEPGVRQFASDALRSCGYTVLSATCGDAALKVMETRGDSVDLLVTDVVMPGTSGRALTESLSTRFPALKALFMSGYTDDAIVRHGVLQNEVAFLQKPFTPHLLAKKVRDVLDRKA